MKIRIAVAVTAFSLLLLNGCASYMRVTTEVYVGQLPPDELPATVGETATVAYHALDGYENHVRDAARKSYSALMTHLTTEYPRFFGDVTSVPSFEESLSEPLEKALEPARDLADQARMLAQQLGAPSASKTDTFKDGANLEQGLLELRELLEKTGSTGQESVRIFAAAETNLYRSVLRKNFLRSIPRERIVKRKKITVEFFPNDQLLAEKSGRKIDSQNARKAAIEDLIKEIADIQVAGDKHIARALASPALSAARLVSATIIAPLDDRAIPMILTAPDTPDNWKRAVNDVVSLNRFGNSEVAFRMDNLGDSHIKGVLFDPSETMKAGFNVFTKALEVTAAAYGANFGAAKANTATTSTSTSATTATTDESAASTSASTPPAPSKPVIDAEIARNAAKASTRGETMESLFRRLTEVAKALPSSDDDPAPGAAKKLLAAVKCGQDELADPQGRLCGGE